jgi:MerR family mercuric resistance operon transcriptional regulator
MGIGELARIGGCSVESIRHYERLGLIPNPPRTSGGHRQYGDLHIRCTKFIRNGRHLGFSLDEVGALLRMITQQDVSCEKIREIGKAHVLSVRQRISELQQLESILDKSVRKCRGGDQPECAIVDHLFASA